MSEAEDEAMKAEVEEAVRDAVDYALGCPLPEPETALMHVYADQPVDRGGRQWLRNRSSKPSATVCAR